MAFTSTMLSGAVALASLTTAPPVVEKPAPKPKAAAQTAFNPLDLLNLLEEKGPNPVLAAQFSALGPFVTGSLAQYIVLYIYYFNPNAGGNVVSSAFYTAAPLGLGLGHLYARDYRRAFDVSTRGMAAPIVGSGLGTAADWAIGLTGVNMPPVFSGLGAMAGPLGYGAWAVNDAYETAKRKRKTK